MNTKRFFAIMLCFTMLFSALPTLKVFAADEGSITPCDVTLKLREEFADDLCETSVKEDDGYIGIPVVFSVFRRESVPSNKTVVVYIVGHKEKRIGTDSDTEIINDLLNEGYIVSVLDYLDSEKAVGDGLAWSVQKINSIDICGTKKYVGGNAFNSKSVYPVPAGCRIVRGIYYFSLDTMAPYGVNEYIVETYNMYYAGVKKDKNGELLKEATSVYDCLKADGTPINMDLVLDIVYPSNPSETVPVFTLASSSETYNGSINSEVRPYFPKALLSGYAAVLYEHEYIPMSRDDHFGYLDERFTLSHYTANKVHSAAIRRVRYLADTYGYDADYISSFGFSKSGANSVLADINHTEKGESKTLDSYCPEGKDPTDTPEEQPWLYYEGTNEPISSDITALYTGAGTGLNQMRDWAITDNSVPLIGSIGNLDDTAGFRWQIPQVEGYLDTLTSETCFLEGDGIGHNPAYGYDEAKEIDNFTTIWTWLDNHVRAAYREEAPKVLWMLPKTGSFFSEMNQPIEIKFSRAMDAQSIKEGVKVVRLADNKVIEGEWAAMHGNTTFTFTSALLIPGSKYRVEITDACKAKDGVYLKEEFTKSFALAGDEFLTATKNSTTASNASQGLSVSPAALGDYKTSITFNREGGFGDVVRASLILNRTNDQNTQLNISGENGFSLLHPLDNDIEVIDVSDYVKGKSQEEISFDLSSLSKSGTTLSYDFESGNNNNFKNNVHYRLGGTGTPTCSITNEAHSGNYGFSMTNRNSDSRIKFTKSTSSNRLSQSDLGSTFKISYYIKASTNTSVTNGMYVESGTPYNAFGAVNVFVQANKWTLVEYSVSITQEMIDNNTTCFGINPLESCDVHLDDITVSYDAGVTTFTSIEQATTSNNLLAPTLVLFTPNSKDYELESTQLITSGEMADTVIETNEYYVDGTADSDISDTKKGYLKMPISALDVSANKINLNFEVNTDGKSSISVYGILDDDSRFAENFNQNITWNNAFANDISGYSVDLSKVYGSNALATLQATETTNFTIDVTNYVKEMKNKGYNSVTFIFVSNVNKETTSENFNKITSFSNYKADATLNGFNHGLTADPTDPTNKVLYFEKSGTGSPVNGYYQRIYLSGYLGTNGKWTNDDIGTKYTVTYRMYNKTAGAATGVYCFIYSSGGNDKNVPGAVRTIEGDGPNKWFNVTFTFTVTKEYVTNYNSCTSIIIGSGTGALATYIDDLKVVKEVGNTSITLNNTSPALSDGTNTALYSLGAVVDGAKVNESVAISNALPVSKTAISGVQGISKVYYTFDKSDVQRIDDAKLTVKVESPDLNSKIYVYGLTKAQTDKCCWNTAFANGNANTMNSALVSSSTPVEIVLTSATEYTVDVTDFVSQLRKEDKISFVITAADDTDKTVIKSVSLNISGSASDISDSFAYITKTQNQNGKVLISAESQHALETYINDVKFYIDGKLYEGEIIKNGDTYHTYAPLSEGDHTVYAVFTYTDETSKTTQAKTFNVNANEQTALKGDVDGNGSVNTADLATLKKLVAGLINQNDQSVVNPDVNGDKVVNTTDLAQLKKIVAGLQ